MPKHILGIDHLVILAGDLDAAAETYRRLGFTISPRGVHSAHMGSANHTIMLRDDYFELLSVIAPTDSNEKWRERLAVGEGIWATALKTDDAAAMGAEMTALGITVGETLDFSRPVDLPGGGTGEAAFKVTPIRAPGSVIDGLFACQHLTRETVWLPGLTEHANTAVGLAAVDAEAPDPAAAADALARLFDAAPGAGADGVVALQAGSVRLRLHAGPADGRPIRFRGLTLAVSSIDAAASALDGVPHHRDGDLLTVDPAAACGAALSFEPEA